MAGVPGWIGLNALLSQPGYAPIDAASFAWLELRVRLAALNVIVLILATQRRDDELASHRDQLTFELAILADRKSPRIVKLLEELRRDMPSVRNRIDPEAASMASQANPEAVLDAIRDRHGRPPEGASFLLGTPRRDQANG